MNVVFMKNMLRILFIDYSDNIFVQIFRYALVGGTAFLFDFSFLWMFTALLGLYYLVSATLSFIVGVAINYSLSVLWVFSGADRSVNSKKNEFIIFFVIGIFGLFLNDLIIWFFTDYIRYHYLVSKVISTIIVFLFNFFIRKIVLFQKIKTVSGVIYD
jgi:putative flippase GtrA